MISRRGNTARAETLDTGHSAMRALQAELSAADDQKIIRITAMLDEVSDATNKQAILDPLRARLGALKPARPLRLARLLFTPLDPLIVPAKQWYPGEPTIPRTALMPMAHMVQAKLQSDAAKIEACIAGQKADAVQVVTDAGETLWPRAAEILAASSPPADWLETGLPPALYGGLARAVATVLRNAIRLRRLMRDGEVAMLETNQHIIGEILRDIVNEPIEGCVMIAQLILLQLPRAAPLLRQFGSAVQDRADKAKWHHAMTRGTEHALSQIENDPSFIGDIARAPLTEVGTQARRIITLLQEIDHEAGVAAHRPRLKALRDKLDGVCRTRFAEGLMEGLVQPLAAATGPVDKASQANLESCLRDLRAFETVVRKVGGSATYDALLHQASESVRIAAESGTLSPVRKFRLIELLSGSETATAMYKQETATV